LCENDRPDGIPVKEKEENEMAKYTIRYNELVEYVAEFETDVEITRGPEIDSMQLVKKNGWFV